MTEYEKGYKDGMAGAALPNIIDNGDKIDGYAYSYKTDSDGVPYINIDCVRAMLTKATDVQHGYWTDLNNDAIYHYECSCCKGHTDWHEKFCPNCGARMDLEDGDTNG